MCEWVWGVQKHIKMVIDYLFFPARAGITVPVMKRWNWPIAVIFQVWRSTWKWSLVTQELILFPGITVPVMEWWNWPLVVIFEVYRSTWKWSLVTLFPGITVSVMEWWNSDLWGVKKHVKIIIGYSETYSFSWNHCACCGEMKLAMSHNRTCHKFSWNISQLAAGSDSVSVCMLITLSYIDSYSRTLFLQKSAMMVHWMWYVLSFS
jgi:hypothetical protein